MTQDSIHPLILSLLEKRGIKTSEFDQFFSWDLKALPDLSKLLDMDKAVQRILKAISFNEKIGIYGDYDVDGTTSCALLFHFFEMIGVPVEIFQPSRFIEGYGVHPVSIDNALEKDIKVLITVDCGISNIETAEYAQGKLDLIITDHHKDAREKLPPAFAVINPNRRDDPAAAELGSLSGVGVAFALSLAIRNELLKSDPTVPTIYPLLQFVAIGTICDMAPLTPVNLKLCRHGIKQIPTTKYPGLKSFLSMDEISHGFIESDKIPFTIGPMINSKGRLEHPDLAFKLLISKQDADAKQLHFELSESNRQRKIIQKDVFDSAKQLLMKEMNSTELMGAVIYSPEFHEGVIGIVAAKIVETYNVPALVFTDTEDKSIIKASARTCGELDLFSMLKSCEHHFIKFGGHKAAAGLSMKKENFMAFKKEFLSKLKDIPAILRTKTSFYDLEIKLSDIDAKLVKDLKHLEPFGAMNAKPVFRLKNFELESFTLMKETHVKWNFKSAEQNMKLQGVSFNYIGKWNQPMPDELIKLQKKNPLKADVIIGVNRFRGNEIIQLGVERIFVD